MCGKVSRDYIELESGDVTLRDKMAPFHIRLDNYDILSYKVDDDHGKYVIIDDSDKFLESVDEDKDFLPFCGRNDTLYLFDSKACLSNKSYLIKKVLIQDNSVVKYGEVEDYSRILESEPSNIITFNPEKIIICKEGVLEAISNNKRLWRHDFNLKRPSPFAVQIDDALVAIFEKEIYIMSAETGDIRFKFPTDKLNIPRYMSYSQVIHYLSGPYIVINETTHNVLYCLDLQGGAVLWKKDIGDELFQYGKGGLSVPYVESEMESYLVYVNSKSIYLIEIESGNEIKVELSGTEVHNYFVKDNEILYILDKSGKLHKFSLGDMKGHSKIKL